MKERQILMKAGPVKAILAGRQTQDRKPIKPLPHFRGVLDNATLWPDGWWRINFAKPYPIGMGGLPEAGWRAVCKYGNPGDRLWVRETFVLESNFNIGSHLPPFDDGRPVRWVEDEEFGRYWQQPHYRATDPTPELYYPDREDGTVKWTPSIHMPRWASRITLEITDVRVERVRDISEGDAQREGWDMSNLPWGHCYDGTHHARDWFHELWDSIYGKQGLWWDMNPWVWVLDFKVVQKGD